jgi:dTDP-4-amino-4,6-dideoxygalactose transaminase
VIIPQVLPFNRSVFNQYVIRTPERDALRLFLKKKGIATEIYYPLPLHLQPCYKNLGYRLGDFPMAEKASRESLALPIDPALTEEEIEYIVSAIEDFFG